MIKTELASYPRIEHSRLTVEIPLQFGSFPSVRTLRRIARTGEPILSGRDDDRWEIKIFHDKPPRNNEPTAHLIASPQNPQTYGYKEIDLISADHTMTFVNGIQITYVDDSKSPLYVLDDPIDLAQAIQEARRRESIRVLQSFSHTHSLNRTAQLTHHDRFHVMTYLSEAKRRGNQTTRSH